MDVRKVARLARLEISGSEEEKYQQQFRDILKYFEEISSVPTDGVEPLVTPSDVELVFRTDQKEMTITVEEALKNAPEKSGNLFKVPPVV